MSTSYHATDPTQLQRRLRDKQNGQAPPPPQAELTVLPTTDTGNAERLVERHGRDLRYISTHRTWMCWTVTHWVRDETGAIDQLAKATVRSIPQEAAALEGDPYTKHLKWAIASESSRGRAALIDLATSEPGIPARPEDFDRDPWRINVANGTIDLRTGTLRPHERADLIAKLAPVTYDAKATCPRFLAWLRQIMLGREDLVTFLQRALGYSLTGKASERVVFILHGGGHNGKTTLIETMSGLLADYAGTAPAEMLLTKREASIPNDLARLPGTRFVSATETGEGRRLDEPKVKAISGGDTISARFMRGEWFDFKPTFKLWLGTNHKPEIRGTDNAIWDRIRLVPFDYRVTDDEKIPDLAEAFVAEEGPGILAWMVEGCLAWQRDGLTAPAEVMQATAQYRREMDPLANWIEDRCELHPGARESTKALYDDYESYCQRAGDEPVTKRTLGVKLTDRGCGDAKSGGTRYRTGIRLVDPNGPSQAAFDTDGDTSHCDPPRDVASQDMSHQKAYETGDFGEQAGHVGHKGHGFRHKRLVDITSRGYTDYCVPCVPNVPAEAKKAHETGDFDGTQGGTLRPSEGQIGTQRRSDVHMHTPFEHSNNSNNRSGHAPWDAHTVADDLADFGGKEQR